MLAALIFGAVASAKTFDSATPPLGWNSYNSYNCAPSEEAIRASAQGLVDHGLADRGYVIVVVDCGWPGRDRASDGSLQWNETLFPSGGNALGEHLHELGLRFGMYSGGGYYQCGSTDLPASLGYEGIDAASFADWGADFLKYDNCYGTSRDVMADYDTLESGSPARFEAMAAALNETERDVMYEICQWGVGTDLATWAPPISNTWRISNDITHDWKSIWRITNQVVPYASSTGPGAFPDMDMLIVGLNALTPTEERFHFGMWAIAKSPLFIGCPLANVSSTSLAVLKNEEVLAINQDPLAKSAELVRRYSEEEWDLWAGALADEKRIVALANWNGDAQTVSVNLTETLGIQSADARDVWAAEDGSIAQVYTTELAGHELRLLVLSNIVSADISTKSTGYHAVSSAIVSDPIANCTQCLPSPFKVTLGSAKFNVTATAGRKLLGVDFVNYDVALDSAWSNGTSTRNMTVTVNEQPKRWAFPISGGSWQESGRLNIEVEGFKEGQNEVSFEAGNGEAPHLVGFEILEYVSQ